MLYYYSDITKEGSVDDLVSLTKGLAGGASQPRSKYLFDWINLPKVGQTPTLFSTLPKLK